MEQWAQTLIGTVAIVAASTGFWSYLQRRGEKKSGSTLLLLGIAHDRIVYLGKNYIDRGWLSLDEYENYITHLGDPYLNAGGNGLAKKVINTVKNLPIHKNQKSIDVRFPEDDEES